MKPSMFVIAGIACAALVFAAGGCKAKPQPFEEPPAAGEAAAPAAEEKGEEAAPPAETPETEGEGAVEKEGGEGANPRVVLETSMGTVKLELFQDKAPDTVKNFLSYVDKGFYDGTLFHRVMSGFMIQGGGFEPGMKKKETDPPVKNEAGNGLSNERGTLAMARTNEVDSATAQFFINHVDNAKLDHKDNTAFGFGYCVFGKVTEGMDVVDKIAAVATTTKGMFENVPVSDVVIKSVKREEP
jgi:cyclophilin family peptidyl-prolyl cis-trans isomerase